MDIEVVENKYHSMQSVCCGDSLYGKADDKAILDHMKTRAESMPCEEVVTYCVSCTNGVYNGGRTPRLLTDLIFGEETAAPTSRMTHEKYREQLLDYNKRH